MSEPGYYRFFDMALASALVLPELGEPLANDPGLEKLLISVSRRGVDETRIEWHDETDLCEPASGLEYGRLGSGHLLRAPDRVDFVIDSRNGSISCHPYPNVAPRAVRQALLDQALPRLAGQSGRLVLHASAALHAGEAIAFVGRSGWGKSTLAASFDRGDQLFADDSLLLQMQGGQAWSIASYLGARLWPDAIEALYSHPPGVSEFCPGSSKKRVAGAGRQGSGCHSYPLGGVFLLNDPVTEPCRELSIVPLQGRDVLMLLLARTFLLDAHDMGAVQKLLRHAADLLRSGVPVARLNYPRAHQDLPRVRRTVLEYLACKARAPLIDSGLRTH